MEPPRHRQHPAFYPLPLHLFVQFGAVAAPRLRQSIRMATYEEGVLSDIEYDYAIFLGEDAFYGCLVERFSDQGLSEASQRVNVGEPAHPINGCAFIQDDSSRALHLTDKLTISLF